MIDEYKDWHPADIIAALKKRGTTLAEVSRNAGLSSSTLSNALARPWPRGEYLIAHALGVMPYEIWPSRYIDSTTNKLREREPRKRKETALGKIIN